MIPISTGQLELMRVTTAGNRPGRCVVHRPTTVKTPTGGTRPGDPIIVAHSGLRISLAANDAQEMIQAAVQTNQQGFTLALDPGILVKPKDWVIETGSGRRFDVVAQQGPRTTGTETIVLATESLK